MDKREKKNWWYWIGVAILIILLLGLMDDGQKYKEYQRCVDYCKGDLYCFTYDIQDSYGKSYMSYDSFDLCRSSFFSCLDYCKYP